MNETANVQTENRVNVETATLPVEEKGKKGKKDKKETAPLSRLGKMREILAKDKEARENCITSYGIKDETDKGAVKLPGMFKTRVAKEVAKEVEAKEENVGATGTISPINPEGRTRESFRAMSNSAAAQILRL